MENMDDLALRKRIDKYEQTRKRLSNVNSKYRTCSDKEIIEYLADEIEQYRSRIKNLERIITNKSKLEERTSITYSEEDIIDDKLVEIKTTNLMSGGKLTKTIMEYEYKD